MSKEDTITDATNKILDILEDNDLTIAESVAILEILKHSLLRSGEELQLSSGVTIQ